MGSAPEEEKIKKGSSSNCQAGTLDGSYLIFTSDRPDGMGRGDLYISFGTGDGSWCPPRNMGKSINTEGYEFCPLLSPDGKYLFFTRNIDGQGDIYWVDAKVIESFKPQGNALK